MRKKIDSNVPLFFLKDLAFIYKPQTSLFLTLWTMSTVVIPRTKNVFGTKKVIVEFWFSHLIQQILDISSIVCQI